MKRSDLKVFVFQKASARAAEIGAYVFNGTSACSITISSANPLPRRKDPGWYWIMNQSANGSLLTVVSNDGTNFYTSRSVANFVLSPGDNVMIHYDGTRFTVQGKYTEQVTATVIAGSAISLTTATAANITSISVPPGNWLITRQVDYALTGATATNFKSGPSLTTGTLPTQTGGSGLGTDPLVSTPLITTTVTDILSQVGGVTPYSNTSGASATVFLVAQATFAVGSVTAYGTITAVRV